MENNYPNLFESLNWVVSNRTTSAKPFFGKCLYVKKTPNKQINTSQPTKKGEFGRFLNQGVCFRFRSHIKTLTQKSESYSWNELRYLFSLALWVCANKPGSTATATRPVPWRKIWKTGSGRFNRDPKKTRERNESRSKEESLIRIAFSLLFSHTHTHSHTHMLLSLMPLQLNSWRSSQMCEDEQRQMFQREKQHFLLSCIRRNERQGSMVF